MADSNPYRKPHQRTVKSRYDDGPGSFTASACIVEPGTPRPDHFCGDCANYVTGGFCGERLLEVGYLWGVCEKYTTEKTQPTMKTQKTTPATKVCKKCGRELPAEAFGRHARSGDGLQPYCKECRSKLEKGNPKYGRRKKDGTVSIPAAHAQEVRKFVVEHVSMSRKKDTPVTANPTVREIPDHDLAQELRRRGYDVKCTKTVEL